MSWRGPSYEGEFPSLGWQVYDWTIAHLRVPDGRLAGEPLDLTDEQLTILVKFYGLDELGRFVFRRAAVRRAQGWGKSPLLGLIALAETCGPTRFDGWDAAGEPVGVPPVAPWVQVAAVSEDQADNTYAAAHAMASESALAGAIIDVGLTRIFRIGAPGRMEPVTASAGTRLGQRVTFAVLDETHLWTRRNGGHTLAATIRRNAGKMNGRTFESTNAHLPGADSVAERTYKASQRAAAGLYYDSVEAPEVEDLRDRPRVLGGLRKAYGDSVAWVDLERLADEIADPGTEPDDARRFYFNQLVAGASRPVDMRVWETLARPQAEVPTDSYIGLGFDGSISDDETALYGCTPEGHVFEIAAWSRPPEATEWRVPRLDVDRVVDQTFARYRVGRMFCDPAKWWTEIETWMQRYNSERDEDAVVLMLDTNQTRRFAPACDRFATATREGSITHDGGDGLAAHLAASSKKYVRLADDAADGRSRFVIVKAHTGKIDRAVAAILAHEAARTMPPEPEPPSERRTLFAFT